jgi:hypothetical protein
MSPSARGLRPYFIAAVIGSVIFAIIILKPSSDDQRIYQLLAKLDGLAANETSGLPIFREVKDIVVSILPEVNSQNLTEVFRTPVRVLGRTESGNCFTSKVIVDLAKPTWFSLAIDSQLLMTFSGCGGSDELISAEFSRISL